MIPPRRILRHLGPLVLGLAVLAATPAAAPLRVIEQSVDYPGGEGDMPAHVYAPEGEDRRPGVLVLHTVAGPGPMLEAFARRLAAEGFIAMTPDLFALHDFGPDGRTDHPLVLEDLAGALDFLRRHPRVDASRLGVVGFSFGGRLAVIASARHADVAAVVVYYAVASYQELAKERPVSGRALRSRALTELAGAIRAPVLIHHGEADRTAPARQGALLHEALAAAGKPSTLYLYPGADHLFNAPAGAPTHRPEAERLSWQRTLEFLRGRLAH